MIEVKFFARLRDQLGQTGLALPATAIHTAADVRSALLAQHPHWQDTLSQPSVLVAVNQTMAQWESPVAEGDEVAFFPPVTGG
ncbi:molybdopterin converting factor subunit 1 [Simiduia agarivorans]|uniref:Molybdopterin synthase sulfur carrier subunit n=1 Tax=Simiduia agarivorans (strain DSM 21679 / JCM 13881 / BCRC 17597 / SA1) TaxID=1117647 RepID=K4KWI3_SIMAS|nr:molybdopterin converting factor subunit 1 [Simiduia agarivorans]AFU98282.1 molybdopterin converting factor subunit 1 [Simiduia agarivorans SA1 = DSM 21679]